MDNPISKPDRGILEALIGRVEEASGADRELDADLGAALEGGEVGWRTANFTMDIHPYIRRPSENHIGSFANEHVPFFTASIDAALGLVERMLPGWSYMLDTRPVARKEGCIRIRLYAPGLIAATFDPPVVRGSHAEAHGQTPPLAILTALLRALSQDTSQ